MCALLIVFVHVCVCVYKRACSHMHTLGQAPWKQQQRSSAFKWIKTPSTIPRASRHWTGPGCSLDEDLRLIISHAAFVFLLLLLHIRAILRNIWKCLRILAGETGISQSTLFVFLPSVLNLLLSFSPAPLLNISCYQLCRAAAVERFLSSECIPAECLCLVCRHAACLIFAIIHELLLWFPQDLACHSHTSCNESSPINQVNISVLQLLHTTFGI